MLRLRRTLLQALAAVPAAGGAFFAAEAAPEATAGMDALECIHTRRSIRSYQDRPVPDELVRAVLAAAMTAPSAGNEQPWRFVVFRDKALLAEAARIGPGAGMAARAPLAVLVCGDESLSRYGSPGVNYLPCDLAAATQNLLLAAHAHGLGAVWTGVWPMAPLMAGFRTLARLPEGVFPFAFVPLGWPGQPSRRENRFREDRVRYDGWS